MTTEQTILALVEPDSDTQRSLERGLRLARSFDASLEVLVPVYDQFLAHDDKAIESLLTHRHEAISDLIGETDTEDVNIRIAVRWGRPTEDIVLTRTEELNPLVVIKETDHHSVLKRTLLTATDWELIRHCPSPLILTKDRDLAEHPAIVAAIDPEPGQQFSGSLTETLLEVAGTLSKGLGGSMTALHVLDSRQFTLAAHAHSAALATGTDANPVLTPLTPQEIESLRTEKMKSLDKTLTAANVDTASGVLRVEDPATGIVNYAEEQDADFVVLGAVARGFLNRILIGHTAERILDRLPCDLVVTRTSTPT